MFSERERKNSIFLAAKMVIVVFAIHNRFSIVCVPGVCNSFARIEIEAALSIH